MSNKQTKTQRNAKGVLFEQPEEQGHGQPAKAWPMNKQKWMEMLKKFSLSNQKSENVNSQLQDGL